MSTRSPRADAVRNREAIVDAAVALFGRDPRASLADVATAAGVGRVTLYGHFSSRDELLEAAVARAIARADADLAELDLTGDALAALDRLVRHSWEIVAGFHGLLVAMDRDFPSEHLRNHHAAPLARLEALVRRGQDEGSMRTDLSASWLTTCTTVILHSAAAELRAGRLGDGEPAEIVAATVRSLMAR